MTDRTKPEIDHPEGDAPAELISVDEIIGDGEEAGRGDVVDVHYVGVSHSTGEQFDASWGRGEPLRFQLGVGQVISGWDQGVQGMTVGGRRRLDIPASLGYGAQGAPPVIAPNEALIFVCDLVAALESRAAPPRGRRGGAREGRSPSSRPPPSLFPSPRRPLRRPARAAPPRPGSPACAPRPASRWSTNCRWRACAWWVCSRIWTGPSSTRSRRRPPPPVPA